MAGHILIQEGHSTPSVPVSSDRKALQWEGGEYFVGAKLVSCGPLLMKHLGSSRRTAGISKELLKKTLSPHGTPTSRAVPSSAYRELALALEMVIESARTWTGPLPISFDGVAAFPHFTPYYQQGHA
jgi:hypothetical protein